VNYSLYKFLKVKFGGLALRAKWRILGHVGVRIVEKTFRHLTSVEGRSPFHARHVCGIVVCQQAECYTRGKPIRHDVCLLLT